MPSEIMEIIEDAAFDVILELMKKDARKMKVRVTEDELYIVVDDIIERHLDYTKFICVFQDEKLCGEICEDDESYEDCVKECLEEPLYCEPEPEYLSTLKEIARKEIERLKEELSPEN